MYMVKLLALQNSVFMTMIIMPICSMLLYVVGLQVQLRWPTELNMLQLQKTHANRKSTSKSRKYNQFDSRGCKCSQHNQINHFICSTSICWLCCDYLQRGRCKIEEVVYLICICFLLFAARWAVTNDRCRFYVIQVHLNKLECSGKVHLFN